MTTLTDDEYLGAEKRHLEHMTRFAAAHAGMPAAQRDFLIGLERQEHWAICIGAERAEIVRSPYAAPGYIVEREG